MPFVVAGIISIICSKQFELNNLGIPENIGFIHCTGIWQVTGSSYKRTYIGNCNRKSQYNNYLSLIA